MRIAFWRYIAFASAIFLASCAQTQQSAQIQQEIQEQTLLTRAPREEPPYWSTTDKTFCDPSNPEHVITVASWNILKKRLETRRDKSAFNPFVAVVRRLNADLLFIQESTPAADEVEELRTRLGEDYKLLLSTGAGGEKLAVIYDSTVLAVEPAVPANRSVLKDVGLHPPKKRGHKMVRQPMVVYAKVLGPSMSSKQPFGALFLNTHTKPEADFAELNLLKLNYDGIVADRIAERAAVVGGGHQPVGRRANLDVIIIGDVNAAPTVLLIKGPGPHLLRTLSYT